MRAPKAAWPIQVRRRAVHEFWQVHWNRIVTVRTEYAVAQLLAQAGPALLDDAVRRRWVPVDMVGEAHRCLSPGRGSVVRTKILTAAEGGAISEAERLLHHTCGTPGSVDGGRTPRSAWARSTGPATWLFDEIRLLIEIDGFAFHTDHDRYEGDGRRQNEFTVAGWTVLRFTWWTLTTETARAVREIEATIARLHGR